MSEKTCGTCEWFERNAEGIGRHMCTNVLSPRLLVNEDGVFPCHQPRED